MSGKLNFIEIGDSLINLQNVISIHQDADKQVVNIRYTDGSVDKIPVDKQAFADVIDRITYLMV